MNQLLWNVHQDHQPQLVKELQNELSCSETFAKLCLNRGLNSKSEVEAFIEPDETWLHDPYSMYDMDCLVERVLQAVSENQKVLIYGDYDADGVTSTAIIYETLLTLGLEPSYYIPDRFKDGYGPNLDRYKEAIDQGTDLIITVDNGVAGHEAIDYAMSRGVDVIVTDHHELPTELPKAYAIVHPKHPKGNYPFKELAGAGVALKVAHALLEDFPLEFLDLAAIGTVADMVSLTDENRAIVYFGLKQLKQTQRLGLRQLCYDLGIKMSDLNEQSIGFKIGPVINAVGRLDQANIVVDLLTSFDQEHIETVCRQLIDINDQRKEIVSVIVEEALAMVNDEDEINILKDSNWHEGVLGIVASRIVRATGKPTIILKEFDERGIVKGSARSVEKFDLFKACNKAKGLFTHFGGHKMAAGMTLDTENLPKLKAHLEKEISQLKQTTDVKVELQIDTQIDLSEITVDVINEIKLLAPFGMDNPEPTFVIHEVQASSNRRIGQNKDHLKLTLENNNQAVDSIAFSLGHLNDYISPASSLSIVGKLDENEWNGNKKAQLMVEDIKIKSPLVYDKRTSQLKKAMFQAENALYICFKQQTVESIKSIIKTSSKVSLASQIEEKPLEFNQIVIVDCPDDISEMADLYLKIANNPIEVYFYKSHSLYLNGLPTKEETVKLYKYLASHPKLPVNELQDQLTNYLKLSKLTYNLILKMFLEVNFVKIENDWLIFQYPKAKINLLKTNAYQSFEKAMEAEKLLIFSSKDELVGLLSRFNHNDNNEEK